MPPNMPPQQERECLDCGLEVGVSESDFKTPASGQHCPKCDADLFAQTDNSLLTRDIAHQQETVARAVDKMDAVLQQVWASYAKGTRLIVGGGRIREEILGQLQFYQDQGYIRGYEQEAPNYGAIVVTMR